MKRKKAHFAQCQTEIKLSCPESKTKEKSQRQKKEKKTHFTQCQCQTEIKLSCPESKTKKSQREKKRKKAHLHNVKQR